ncbi:MAG TPA: hypothetical protein ENK06_13110 [Gammaproteobacteria bacterium]|nr:hypothetical protein [Gammaproteobacteria bacterium]
MNTNPINIIGMQNVNILNQISSAYKASLKLAEDGFTVLQISLGSGMPVITLARCKACDELNGIRTIRSEVEQIIYRVDDSRHDCIVQWSVAGPVNSERLHGGNYER